MASWSLGDEGVTLLIAGLIRPRVHQLITLALPDCGMSSLGVKALAALLFSSNHIEFLNISRNEIGEQGLVDLEPAFLVRDIPTVCISPLNRMLSVGKYIIATLGNTYVWSASNTCGASPANHE